MILDRVTISGADDKVDHHNLCYLQERFPFVEWGILLSPTRAGTPRYPSQQWIEKLPNCELNCSAHLCGDYARAILERGDHGKITEVKKYFNRFQMNYSFKNSSIDSINELLEYADAAWDTDIVLPYNEGNKAAIDFMILHNKIPDNIHFLYDSSGGRGTLIKSIEPPLPTYTGYAGGIDPENIGTIVGIIHGYEKARYDFTSRNVWIDMESGVRTNDAFDLTKVEKVLEFCSRFVK